MVYLLVLYKDRTIGVFSVKLRCYNFLESVVFELKSKLQGCGDTSPNRLCAIPHPLRSTSNGSVFLDKIVLKAVDTIGNCQNPVFSLGVISTCT